MQNLQEKRQEARTNPKVLDQADKLRLLKASKENMAAVVKMKPIPQFETIKYLYVFQLVKIHSCTRKATQWQQSDQVANNHVQKPVQYTSVLSVNTSKIQSKWFLTIVNPDRFQNLKAYWICNTVIFLTKPILFILFFSTVLMLPPCHLSTRATAQELCDSHLPDL